MKSVNIGVLGFQGSVREHMHSLSGIPGVNAFIVRNQDELNKADGLVLPGGESTTLGKLLTIYNMIEPIKEAAKSGKPIWGTCAGAILLAKKITGSDVVHLGVMDIEVTRNAYGTQLDSFTCNYNIPEVSPEELPLVFIRAPIIKEAGPNVQILAKVNGAIVAARENNLLATSFHPELTDDLSFHKYFIGMI